MVFVLNVFFVWRIRRKYITIFDVILAVFKFVLVWDLGRVVEFLR